MPVLNAGANATVTFSASSDLVTVTVPVGGLVTFEYPVGTVIDVSAASKTYGPYASGQGRITATGRDAFYEQADAPQAVSGGITQLGFSATIPLAYASAAMPRTTVSGALALTADAAGAAEGNSTLLSFVSDGTNVPSISGSTALNTDFGYDNSQAGLQNFLQVVYLAGAARHQWFQPAVNTPIDVTAPTAGTATVENATATVINLVISEAADTSAAPFSASFAVTGHTVSSVAWGTSTRLDITVTPAFVNGEAARTLAYTPGTNPIKDVAGNQMAAFTGKAITNNVGVDSSSSLTLSPLVSLTDEGGNVYLGGAGGGYANYGRAGALVRPANTEAAIYLSHEVASNSAAVVGFSLTATPTEATTMRFQMQLSTAASNIRGGTDIAVGSGSVIQSLSAAAGTWARLRVTAAGVCTIEVSTDNRATWTVVQTLSGTSAAVPLYPIWFTITGNRIRNPRHYGLA